MAVIPQEISRSRYVRLVTHRRDGTGVPTPVWAAEDGGELLVWTLRDSGKVKRLRRDGRVTLTPCTVRGKTAEDATPVEAHATVLDGAAHLTRVRAAIAAKYGWQFRLFDLLGKVRRSGRTPHVGLAVRVPSPPRP